MDYGREPLFLVGADLSKEQYDEIVLQPDVYDVSDLDGEIGDNLSQVHNWLEQQNIPAKWVEPTTTNRQIVGRVGRMCFILQRINGYHKKRLFVSGISLDSKLTEELLSELVGIGKSLDVDTKGLSTELTVQEALLLLSDSIQQFTFAKEVF